MLSPEQIEKRKNKLTASRIAVIMNGDAEGIDLLYRQLIGEAVEVDLSDYWPARRGMATEDLNLEWYERKIRNPLTRRGEVVIDPFLPWAAATLDAWDDVLHCPIECKDVGGREPFDPVIIDRYYPQCSWQMFVTGARQCALSVIIAGNEPIVEYIKRADDYIEEMVVRAEAFMLCVQTRTPPVALAAVPPPAERTIVHDMSQNNRWCDQAIEWIATHEFADRAKDAEKILKELVPPDAKKCFGAGVYISVSRSGAKSLREGEGK